MTGQTVHANGRVFWRHEYSGASTTLASWLGGEEPFDAARPGLES